METVLLELDRPAAADGGSAVGDAAVSAGETNLAGAFVKVARARANHPAVVTKSGIYTYGWLLRAADSVRRYLATRPYYAPGARVALELANSPEYLAAFYGTLLADCVVVPMPAPLDGERRRRLHDLCRPDVLISRREDSGAHNAAATVLRLGEDGDIAVPDLRRGGSDLAMLLSTSGSTGAPKAVMLSHRNLLSNAGSILQELPIGAGDRALVLLPFCHAFGNSILQTHILSGATLLLNGPLMFPAAVATALHDLNATSLSAVPEVYTMLLRYGGLGERPLPALRYMAVAGGALRHELAAQLIELIAPAPFYVMYGQSEATARLTALPPHEFEARRGSIGRPIAGVELAVMDEAGRALPDGAVGMLCARGPNVMLGYWQDEAATADVLRGEGWLRTGDLAHRDADGFYYLDGRANLLVKVQGHRVHPAEIESMVETGFPHARAAAIPVARGDNTRFVLFLEPRDGHPIDVARVRAMCQRELPAYKVPLHIEVLDRLPLTSGHKIDRAALALLGAQVPSPAA